MMRVTLIRHAKTERIAASGLDEDRELTERGHHDARLLAGKLGGLGSLPPRVFVSSAKRAMQTYAEMRRAVPALPEPDERDELYLADVADLFNILYEAGPGSEFWIVAHNPGIPEFIGDVTGAYPEHFSTSTAAVLEMDDDFVSGGGRLLTTVSARELR